LSVFGQISLDSFGQFRFIRLVKLRDDPLMSDRKGPNWPPVWTHTADGSVRTLLGEVGSLRHVYADPLSSKCFLVIDFEAENYTGSLTFKDPGFSKEIISLLRENIGHSIKEIGDLDLAPTLNSV
jgi:hypothetical protein